MIHALLSVALAAGSPPPGAPEGAIKKEVVMGRLDIPDEIAPAVLPYMGCLIARDGIEVRGEYDPRPSGVQAGADCTGFRERAVRNADTLLRRAGGRSKAERHAFIEATLQEMEAFQRASASRKAVNAED